MFLKNMKNSQLLDNMNSKKTPIGVQCLIVELRLLLKTIWVNVQYAGLSSAYSAKLNITVEKDARQQFRLL